MDGFVNSMPGIEQGDTFDTHMGRERAGSVKKSREQLKEARTIK